MVGNYRGADRSLANRVRVQRQFFRRSPVKLTNMTITPKLGILVGVTLLGLCAAGVLAGYLMQREMMNAKIDQLHAVVDMARNMAAGLQKQVDAGQMTKEAAIAEFGKRANSLTFDKGQGYLFGSTMEGVTVLSPDARQIGQNRLDTLTNGKKIGREWPGGVAPTVIPTIASQSI